MKKLVYYILRITSCCYWWKTLLLGFHLGSLRVDSEAIIDLLLLDSFPLAMGGYAAADHGSSGME